MIVNEKGENMFEDSDESIDNDNRDFTFEILDEIFSEEQIIEKYIADWGYLRPKRGEFPTFQFTFPNPDELYFLISICTSPSEYVGRIIGHSGIGEYADVIVDGGTMTINPRYTGELNFRRKGVGRSRRQPGLPTPIPPPRCGRHPTKAPSHLVAWRPNYRRPAFADAPASQPL